MTPMTVTQLIEKLSAYPGDYRVQLVQSGYCPMCKTDDPMPPEEVDEVRTAAGLSGHGLAVEIW
jgi:hypothetical protein